MPKWSAEVGDMPESEAVLTQNPERASHKLGVTGRGSCYPIQDKLGTNTRTEMLLSSSRSSDRPVQTACSERSPLWNLPSRQPWQSLLVDT